MESQWFDALIRSLADGDTGRRSALRLLAGGLLGVTGWLGAAEAGAHDARERCRRIEDRKKRKACLERAKQHNDQHEAQDPPRCRVRNCPKPSATQTCGRRACVGGKCRIKPVAAGRQCQAGSCIAQGPGFVARPASACTGTSPTCPAAVERPCELYGCVDGDCRTSCGDDGHCSGNAWCDQPVCREQQGLGTTCAAPRQCASGHCVDATCCDGPCQAGPNADSTCANGGVCQVTCHQGWGACDGDPANGCETDLLSDPRHCGACNSRCLGPCGGSKNPGFWQCENGDCVCNHFEDPA